MSKKSNQFSPEVRERAVRMVLEHRGEYPSLWAAIDSIAPKIGCEPQTLHTWVKRHETDSGVREGVTTSPMATPNCSTYGRSNCSRQDRVDYDYSGLTAMRAAASLRR